MRTLLGILGAIAAPAAIAWLVWRNAVHLTTADKLTAGVVVVIGVVLMIIGVVRRPGVVVAEIVALVVVVAGYFVLQAVTGRSPQKRTMADIRAIATALEARATDRNEYPGAQTIDELAPLLEPTYIKHVPRFDGFDHPYRYAAWQEDPKSRGNDHYAIGSAGHDWQFSMPALRQDQLGATTNFDCDIVYINGTFVSYPK